MTAAETVQRLVIDDVRVDSVTRLGRQNISSQQETRCLQIIKHNRPSCLKIHVSSESNFVQVLRAITWVNVIRDHGTGRT